MLLSDILLLTASAKFLNWDHKSLKDVYLVSNTRHLTTHFYSSIDITHPITIVVRCLNFKGRFLGTSKTDSNCHGDICPGNISPGDICPY